MTEKKLNELKESHVEYVTGFLKARGEMGSLLTVFADHIEEEDESKKASTIHIPVPGQFLENDENKDKFVNEIIPEIFANIKKQFIPKGLAWTAEAWIRKANPKDAANIKNYKDLPISGEVLIISFQKKDETETTVYSIKRDGKVVNDEGELIDSIELEENETFTSKIQESNFQGRFADLFSKFDD